MPYFVGAYAASPNTTGWDPELEARYYARLRAAEHQGAGASLFGHPALAR